MTVWDHQSISGCWGHAMDTERMFALEERA
jgi:hypothetical protein